MEKTDYFSRLPDEMILKIFRYLPAKSLGRCTAVCHRWRRMAFDVDLWQDKTVDLRIIKNISFFELCRFLQLGTRKIVSFRVIIPDPDTWENIFPDNFESKLEWLDLSRCQISTKAMAFILNHTGQLRRLILKYCTLDRKCYEAIGKNKNLTLLSLSNCISSMSREEIEAVFRENRRLYILDGAGYEHVPEFRDDGSNDWPLSLHRLLMSRLRQQQHRLYVHGNVHPGSKVIEFSMHGFEGLRAVNDDGAILNMMFSNDLIEEALLV